MIKKFQKKSYRWSVLGSVVVIAVSTVSLLNAHAEGTNEKLKDQTTEKVAAKEEKIKTIISFKTIVEKMVGTQEQAMAEFGMPAFQYKKTLNETAAAQKFLTTNEFEQYISLTREIVILDGKANAFQDPEKPYNPDLLSVDEKTKLKESAHAIGPLRDKIMSHFIFTAEEAQKLIDFPIKKPTYIADGYLLNKEETRADITLGKPKPIISLEYRKGEFSYTIYQSPIIEAEGHFAWLGENDKVENYELDGNQVSFGYFSGSNTKAMKMIVPAKGKNSAYQIVINDDVLNKTELEKMMISMLK
jgi:bla regulator protein BlaR1